MYKESLYIVALMFVNSILHMKLSKSYYCTQLKDLWFRFTWSDGDILGSIKIEETINNATRSK